MCNGVADQMKIFTRPYVAGEIDLGTGTFIGKGDVHILTCEHVARLDPAAYYIDDAGSLQLQPGKWRMEADPNKDVALAPVPETEWKQVSGRARPLSISRFAQRHAAMKDEFFSLGELLARTQAMLAVSALTRSSPDIAPRRSITPENSEFLRFCGRPVKLL